MNLRTLSDSGGLAVLLERPPPQDPVAASPIRLTGASLWSAFRERYTRARDRRDLQRLNDQLLDDIGLRREEFLAAPGSYWDPP
jgi:uncharacterized protein YjiS (DUF1127 family)